MTRGKAPPDVMALTLEDLHGLDLRLGSPCSLTKMSGGFRNKNYLLTTTLGKYRLRVPQFPRDLENIRSEQGLLNWVTAKSTLPVPLLHVFSLRGGTHVSVFPYVNADPVFDIHNETLVRSAGRALSEYHRAIGAYRGSLCWDTLPSSFRSNGVDIEAMRRAVMNQPDTDNPYFWPAVETLFGRIHTVSAQVNEKPFPSLPHLSCHGDYAPANVLSVKDEVVGIIDFECCRWAPRVHDVATALLALQQTEAYEEQISVWFMAGYQTKIVLTSEELELIPQFQRIRSLESANRHFVMVTQGKLRINVGLVMYWSRITSA